MIFIKTLLKIKSKFDTSNYELDRSYQMEKKIIELKDELGRKITTKFLGLRENVIINYR